MMLRAAIITGKSDHEGFEHILMGFSIKSPLNRDELVE